MDRNLGGINLVVTSENRVLVSVSRCDSCPVNITYDPEHIMSWY